ncbi:putative cupin superfamily protein [Aquamicrobium terrae]|uniref:cupin domain-containing protein n=1 Tax=Mesorhizobium sp. PUT5 TaxID=3454629 RepID=UPI003FA41A1C
MTDTPVISFAGAPLKDQAGAPDPKQVVEGNPQNRTKLFFASADGEFVSGTWKSTPGKWRALSGKDEFCYIVQGHVRLISDSGEIAEFRAGDSFVVPNGFSGFWEIVEETVKHYAIRKYS